MVTWNFLAFECLKDTLKIVKEYIMIYNVEWFWSFWKWKQSLLQGNKLESYPRETEQLFSITQVNSSHGKICTSAWAVGNDLCIEQALELLEKSLIWSMPNPWYFLNFVFCFPELTSIQTSLEFWIVSAPGVNYMPLCILIKCLSGVCNAFVKLHVATTSVKSETKGCPFHEVL